jgi:hypothetical protein
MQGKQVDMEALRTKFELTPAVGNVKMNARGDILDAGGNIIKTKEQLASQGMVGNGTVAPAQPRPQAPEQSPVVEGDDEFEPGLSEEEAMAILAKGKKNKG